jgi:hypothetical protein
VEEFWGLREDPAWDLYNGEIDKQIFTELEREVKVDPDGFEKVIRTHQMKAKVNPIPKALRGMLGSDEFKVVIQAEWYRLKYVEVSSAPPVLALLLACVAR